MINIFPGYLPCSAGPAETAHEVKEGGKEMKEFGITERPRLDLERSCGPCTTQHHFRNPTTGSGQGWCQHIRSGVRPAIAAPSGAN